MYQSVTSHSDIEHAISRYGVNPGGSSMIQAEHTVALESISSTLYITWNPHPSCLLTISASDEIRSGLGQCCRIGSSSVCLCGHSLSNHQNVKLKFGYIKPPACTSCRCKAYQYIPSRPEECGQWWLPRRKDFDLVSWRNRIRQNPADYCCIGCNQKVSEHETLFETRDTRLSRGAMIDDAYIPLNDYSKLSNQVINGNAPIGGKVRPIPKAPVRQRIQPISSADSTSKSMISTIKNDCNHNNIRNNEIVLITKTNTTKLHK
eukprot:gene6740-9235_t